ncbi:MAG TPA: hypothetical protein VGE34_04190 [Candidatus Saccharimonadales bacterium]
MQPNDPQAPEQVPTSPQPYVAPEAPVQQAAEPAPAASAPTQEADPVEAQIEQPIAGQEDAPTELPEMGAVSWQAEEYLQHDKTPMWYVVFILVVVIFMGLAIWQSAWTVVVLIPVTAVALMVYTHRPARLINYTVSSTGFHINDQLHPMGEFKAFGVIQDNGTNALTLIPVKRFRPGITVYFPAEVGEELVDALGAYIPMQELKPDIFDKIISKLRI